MLENYIALHVTVDDDHNFNNKNILCSGFVNEPSWICSFLCYRSYMNISSPKLPDNNHACTAHSSCVHLYCIITMHVQHTVRACTYTV